MRNGGLAQFFFNATAVLAPEAVAGFQAIGMPECASVVAEAMRTFGRVYPRDRERRQTRLHEANEYGALDDRLFELLDSEGGGFEVAADRYARGAVVS